MTTQLSPSKILTPELRASLTRQIDLFLLNIIIANSTTHTRDGSRRNALRRFRNYARNYVPVTDYESYKPWIARFDENLCKESRVDNLFAPGLPYYFAVSSSTSGKEPKLFPAYQHINVGHPPIRPIFDFSDTQGPTVWIFYYGYRETKEVEWEPGQVAKRIPFCLASAGQLRIKFDWDIESDESRMSTIMPSQVAPWGANMIAFNANPARADELREIGPPSSGDGWAVRVWPRLRRLAGVWSGPFWTCLSQVRAILEPTISIRSHGYASSESIMPVFLDPDDLETFVFETQDVLQFVNAEAQGTSTTILQGWDLEAGGRYHIVGPSQRFTRLQVFGQKNLSDRLLHVTVSDAELVAAIQAISSEEFIRVHDFTTVLDERKTPQTVGFIVELSGSPGLNSHITAQGLFDVLAAANNEYHCVFQSGETRPSTIRVVKPGTFMEYRRWRCEKMNIGLGQVKVPVVLSHAESQEWILER
ncbi:hypothetical protein J3R83DRAFT_5217 [Lanmaoa asiatica]|nr:hypothetical protein J3R83DRAFT_5217 [Lanmaoa asiatica]